MRLPLPPSARPADGQPVLYGMRPEHLRAVGRRRLAGRSRRRRADRRRHAALLPLQRPGADVAGARARTTVAPGDTIGLDAGPRARASVRRGERRAARRLRLRHRIDNVDPAPTKEERVMSDFKRRKFLKTPPASPPARPLGTGAPVRASDATRRRWNSTPEKGAKLRVLRWSRFVQGDIDQYMKNVQKFTEKYRHRGARRQRRLGGRAAEGGGRGEHRRGPGHHPVDQRRRQPVSGQAASTSPTSADYLGKQVRRLVSGVRAVPAAGRQEVDRRAARRRRRDAWSTARAC